MVWEKIKDWFSGADWAGTVLKTVIIAVVGIFIIRLVMRILSDALQRGRLEKAAHSLIKTLAKIVLWALLAMIVASSLGIDVTGVVALASVVSLAVSLALQNSLANIVGGFTLLYTHPFGAGDYVEIAGQGGTVQEVGIAYTRLVTSDNKVVSIPNSSVVGDQIVNYSVRGTRRVEINVSVSYEAPIAAVEQALRQATEVENILQDPAPFISVSSYGDSAINYVVRVWAKNEDYWQAYYDVLHKIKEIFDAQKIEMTYPHLNVHLDR